jgi:cytochrome c553
MPTFFTRFFRCRSVLAIVLGLSTLTVAQAQQGVDRAAGAGDIVAHFKALETDPALMQAALLRGRKVAAFCANCHGANGTSTLPDVPNLAGQNSLYLLEQMQRFVDGRRKDPFMGGMIRAMTETERMDVVAFLSGQKVVIGAIDSAALVGRGKSIYSQICFRCHGDQGMGDARIPRLAGQQKAYLVRSLKRYRDGTGERIEPLMAANTRHLTDEDISAVAAYVGSMN